ncbi:MAG: HEAT repeat domain-containing protein, partial [Nitrospirae bacterium]|nr:HEAT repeat domain-containing protein [Nitrospirota bacterium]
MPENIRRPGPFPEPPSDETPVDWESVKQAREIFHGLGKAVKALKIYPATSPLREKFFQETRDKFLKFLDDHGELILRVRRSELFYEGQEVYSNPVKEENFALRLHGDGVREIHFYEGLDEEELRTLLWAKEFDHIRYFVAEGGEEGEEGGGAPVTPTPGGVPGGGAGEGIRQARVEEASRAASGEIAASAGMEAEVESIYGKPLAEIFVLTPEEVAFLKKEMEEESERDLLSDMITMLFQILQVEDDLAGYGEVMGSLEHALRGMVLSGEFVRAIPIIETLRSLTDPKNNHSPAHAAKAGEVIRHLGETEAVRELAYALNAGKGDDQETLRRYLTLLDPNAILPLSDLLGMLDQMKVRRLLCESLAVLARDHVSLLLKKLEDPEWYVVRNIVYILGRIGDDRAVASLKKVLRHPEIRVRKEVVHTLGELQHPEA